MICPNCGADVPPQAKACPECGSCEETGWSEAAETGDLDLPDDEFNYDEFVKKEFGGPSPKPRGISWFWWVVALLLIVVLAIFFLRFR
ncbi:MAG TPA: zinc-ribbon domain-containing protein [Verrucomicrobiae bacterium]|nr:zinc-ribbon domain-containing protein [Verrucomicrobiae bacterium]